MALQRRPEPGPTPADGAVVSPLPAVETPTRQDDMVAQLQAVTSWLARAQPGDVPDAVRIDRIAALEQLRHAAAALQALEVVAFGRSQMSAQRRADVNPRDLGKGIADQVALACHVSPSEGSHRLATARSMVIDLSGTFELWRDGRISATAARKIHGELDHLDPDTRRSLDPALVAAGLPQLSDRQIEGTARRLAQVADPAAAVERIRIKQSERRVTLRPAPDTMTLLTATLPLTQGVACWAALTAHADRMIGTGDVRTRGQIMADTLVERITGQQVATDVNYDVGVLIGIESLLDPHGTRPAEIVGHGPLPAALAREVLGESRGRKAWRRVFSAPPGWRILPPGAEVAAGAERAPDDDPGLSPRRPDPPTEQQAHLAGARRIVAVDERRRRFGGALADLIELRDRHCRDPFCDAPVRHLDHIQPFRSGGQTSLANGRAVCMRGNLVKEMPGWNTQLLEDGLHEDQHTVAVTTPTGHVYLSRADEPP